MRLIKSHIWVRSWWISWMWCWQKIEMLDQLLDRYSNQISSEARWRNYLLTCHSNGHPPYRKQNMVEPLSLSISLAHRLTPNLIWSSPRCPLLSNHKISHNPRDQASSNRSNQTLVKGAPRSLPILARCPMVATRAKESLNKTKHLKLEIHSF